MSETSAEQMISGWFSGPVEPVRVTAGYLLALVAVAALMIVLPAIYLGLVGALGATLVWHATANLAWFETMDSTRLAIAAYVLPLMVGPILLLFMVKPIFARPGRESAPLPLDPASQPVLFEFVRQVAGRVGAPAPRRIQVDCNVNASASFRRGPLSFFNDDLTLTIGLPLAAGMTVRQLGGVIAHEFGHFAQRAAMRLSYLIRAVSHWFGRVVYERDAWDERLAAWSRGGDIRIMLVMWVTRLFVFMTRLVLFVLMIIGHLLSSVLLRQMEYDADRYEARLAGSGCFAETADRLHRLMGGWMTAQRQLASAWQTGQLGDDLPALVVAQSAAPDAEAKALLAEAAERRTGAFDTHPADRDRVAGAAREAAPGVLTLDKPASALFRDFAGLCRAATLHEYRRHIGPEVTEANLIPTERIQARERVRQGAAKALERYFLGAGSIRRGPAFSERQVPARIAPGKALADLQRARERMRAAAPLAVQAARELERIHREALEAAAAAAAARVEGWAAGGATARAKAAQAEGERRRLEAWRRAAAHLRPFDAATSDRLALALALLRVDAVRARVDKVERVDRHLAGLFAALGAIGAAFDATQEVARRFAALQGLIEAAMRAQGNEALVRAVMTETGRTRSALERCRAAFVNTPYPFDHSHGRVMMAPVLVGATLPEAEDVNGVLATAAGLLERSEDCYVQCLGRLALVAEKVEHALDLRPLDPPTDGEIEQARPPAGGVEPPPEDTGDIPLES